MLPTDTAHSPGTGIQAAQGGPQPKTRFSRAPGTGAQGCRGPEEAEISALNAEPWPAILTPHFRRSSVSCSVNCGDMPCHGNRCGKISRQRRYLSLVLGRRSTHVESLQSLSPRQGQGRSGGRSKCHAQNSSHARKRPWLPVPWVFCEHFNTRSHFSLITLTGIIITVFGCCFS